MSESLKPTLLENLLQLVQLRKKAQDVCEPYGLSTREVTVLLLVADGVNGPSELARKVNLQRSAVSAIITKLIASRLLARKDAKADARRKQMTLTSKGLKQVELLKQAWLDAS